MNQSDKREKSNLLASLKRNLKETKEFRFLIIIALILALISSILSTIAPSRLSLITDEISKSLNLNYENLEKINRKVFENFDKSNPDNADIEIDGNIISYQDQIKYIEILNELKSKNISFEKNKRMNEIEQEELLKSYSQFPQSITNIIEPKLNIEKIWNIAKILILIYIVSVLFRYIQSLLMSEVTNNYARKLRNNVADKINRLPLNYFDNNKVGDILSRMTNDVDLISSSLNESLATLVVAITLVLGSAIMMFITNWILALVAIISSLLGLFLAGIILSKSQKYFKRRQKQLGNLNGHIEEIISGIEIVKIYNAKKQSLDKFNELNGELYDSNIKSRFLSGLLNPLMNFTGNFGYLAVSIAGALLVTNRYISFGVIVAFMVYIRLFINPLSEIAQVMTSLQSSSAATDRVFEFMDEEELSDESHIDFYLSPSKVKGMIEFKNIVFKYPRNEEATIKGFSAKALPGQKIAIVGPTGAGKSTMVNLLMKFYEIDKGDILIDGHSIHNITRENIHALFTMILQDTWLFNGTIKENIIYNMKDVTDAELKTLCDFIGLSHFIDTLPKGMETEIKSQDSVSAGQRQLLTIARGMLKNAPFLILDEATSNVDTRTEEIIQEAMDKLMYGKTSFIIAHRLSTIVNADLILVMNHGNIIEQGTHKELLAQNGFYADLYNSQFSLGM